MSKIAVFLSLLGLLILGCSKQGTEPEPQKESRPVAEQVPADIRAILNQHAITDENLPDHLEFPTSDWTVPSLTDTSYEIFVVTFLWGHLFNTPVANAAATDWSGNLYVNGVAYVGVAGVIDFERGEDSLVRTNNPAMAAWVSSTSGDFDGLVAFVFLKKGIVYITAPQLHFTTPPFSISFNFEELVNFSALYNVDSVNSVAVLARRIWPPRCPQGLLVGEWTKADIPGDSGYFNGTWMEANGTPLGIFAGRFWTTDNHERVFDGTISGVMLTVVIGYMRGVWYYDDPRDCILCGSGHGKFKGVYKMVAPNTPAAGVIEGEFGDYSLPVEQLNLPLKGTWRQFCPHFDDNTTPSE